LPASIIALLNIGNNPITAIGGAEQVDVSYRETHWLADAAVGYDIATSGRSSLQLKGGLRIGEMTTKLNSNDATNIFINFKNPLTPPLTGNSIQISTTDFFERRNNFLRPSPLLRLPRTPRFL